MEHNSIRDRLNGSGNVLSRYLSGSKSQIAIDALLQGTSLGCGFKELVGKSILLTTHNQFAAALALIELDGIAKRLIICPPDIQPGHFPLVIAKGGVDAIVSDHELDGQRAFDGILRVSCGHPIVPSEPSRSVSRETEWVLLTSGTTGAPKMIAHTLASLTAPISVKQPAPLGSALVWGTFYDIRRYGGLQIFLRGILGTGSLVLPDTAESVGDHLIRLGASGVTHLTGTPSHWRRALMSPYINRISPRYVRLSGEIADQAILNTLHSVFPEASICHAFASTEAGVAFEVNDGLAGFPASLLGTQGEVEMKVENDTLRIKSNRNALCYPDGGHGPLAGADGFVDTGDVVELRDGRYYFLGRVNGVINVGGMKVYPEEVEAVINCHPAVRMSMVRPRKNSITGALVSADIVLKEGSDAAGIELKGEILELCRKSLPPHKIPATIRLVQALEVAAAGKLVRSHA